MTRTKLVILLIVVGCIPLAMEHLFIHEMMHGDTVTHAKEAQTEAAKDVSAHARAPDVVSLAKKRLRKRKGKKKRVKKSKGDEKGELLELLEKAQQDSKSAKQPRYKERFYSGIPFPVLPHRVQTKKKEGGHFAQHPQSSKYWYETGLEGKVYGYGVVDDLNEEEVILKDQSVPRRPSHFVKVCHLHSHATLVLHVHIIFIVSLCFLFVVFLISFVLFRWWWVHTTRRVAVQRDRGREKESWSPVIPSMTAYISQTTGERPEWCGSSKGARWRNWQMDSVGGYVFPSPSSFFSLIYSGMD